MDIALGRVGSSGNLIGILSGRGAGGGVVVCPMHCKHVLCCLSEWFGCPIIVYRGEGAHMFETKNVRLAINTAHTVTLSHILGEFLKDINFFL